MARTVSLHTSIEFADSGQDAFARHLSLERRGRRWSKLFRSIVWQTANRQANMGHGIKDSRNFFAQRPHQARRTCRRLGDVAGFPSFIWLRLVCFGGSDPSVAARIPLRPESRNGRFGNAAMRGSLPRDRSKRPPIPSAAAPTLAKVFGNGRRRAAARRRPFPRHFRRAKGRANSLLSEVITMLIISVF